MGKPNERERDLLFSFRKVHISSKITMEITQWTTTHNTQKFRQMLGKTPMWGNPTREREIYYSASGKYISEAK